jgi:hypothetical protein
MSLSASVVFGLVYLRELFRLLSDGAELSVGSVTFWLLVFKAFVETSASVYAVSFLCSAVACLPLDPPPPARTRLAE